MKTRLWILIKKWKESFQMMMLIRFLNLLVIWKKEEKELKRLKKRGKKNFTKIFKKDKM